jgi:hypothetical protein
MSRQFLIRMGKDLMVMESCRLENGGTWTKSSLRPIFANFIYNLKIS